MATFHHTSVLLGHYSQAYLWFIFLPGSVNLFLGVKIAWVVGSMGRRWLGSSLRLWLLNTTTKKSRWTWVLENLNMKKCILDSTLYIYISLVLNYLLYDKLFHYYGLRDAETGSWKDQMYSLVHLSPGKGWLWLAIVLWILCFSFILSPQLICFWNSLSV